MVLPDGERIQRQNLSTEEIENHNRRIDEQLDQMSRNYERDRLDANGAVRSDAGYDPNSHFVVREELIQFTNEEKLVQEMLGYAADENIVKEYLCLLPSEAVVSSDQKIEFTDNHIGLHVKSFVSLVLKGLRDLSLVHTQYFKRPKHRTSEFDFGKLVRGFLSPKSIKALVKEDDEEEAFFIEKQKPNLYFLNGNVTMPRFLVCFEPCIRKPGFLTNGMYMWILILDPLFMFEEYLMDLISQYQITCDKNQRKDVSKNSINYNINTDDSNELWKLYASADYWKTTCSLMSPSYSPSMSNAAFEWPITESSVTTVSAQYCKPYSMNDVFDPRRVFRVTGEYMNADFVIQPERSVFSQHQLYHPMLNWLTHNSILDCTRNDFLNKLPYKVNQATWMIITYLYFAKHYPSLKLQISRDIPIKQYIPTFKKKATDLIYRRDIFTRMNLMLMRIMSQWDFITFMITDTMDHLKKKYDMNIGTYDDDDLFAIQSMDIEREKRILSKKKEKIENYLLENFLQRCPEEIEQYVAGKPGNVNDVDFERWGTQLVNDLYFLPHHRMPLFDNLNNLANQVLLWFHSCISDNINTNIGTRQELRWVLFLYLLSSSGVIYDNGHTSSVFYAGNPGIGKREGLMELNRLLNPLHTLLFTVIQHASPGFWNNNASFPTANFDECELGDLGTPANAKNHDTRHPPMKDITAAGYAISVQAMIDPTTKLKKLVNYIIIFASFIFFSNIILKKHADDAFATRVINLIFGYILKEPNPDYKHDPRMMEMMQKMFTVSAYYTKLNREVGFGKQPNNDEVLGILNNFEQIIMKNYGIEIHDRQKDQYLDLYYFLNSAVTVSIMLFTIYGHSRIRSPCKFNAKMFHLINEASVPRPQLMLFVLTLFVRQYLNETDQIIINFFRERYKEYEKSKVPDYFKTISYRVPTKVTLPSGLTETIYHSVNDPRYFQLNIEESKLIENLLLLKLDKVQLEASWHNLITSSKHNHQAKIIHSSMDIPFTCDETRLIASPDPQLMLLSTVKLINNRFTNQKNMIIISIPQLQAPVSNTHSNEFIGTILPRILPFSLDDKIVLPIPLFFNNTILNKYFSFESYESKKEEKRNNKRRKLMTYKDLKEMRTSSSSAQKDSITLDALKNIYSSNSADLYYFVNMSVGCYPDDAIQEKSQNMERMYTIFETQFLSRNINYFQRSANYHFDVTDAGIFFDNFTETCFKMLGYRTDEECERKYYIFKNIRDVRTDMDDNYLLIMKIIEDFNVLLNSNAMNIEKWKTLSVEWKALFDRENLARETIEILIPSYINHSNLLISHFNEKNLSIVFLSKFICTYSNELSNMSFDSLIIDNGNEFKKDYSLFRQFRNIFYTPEVLEMVNKDISIIRRPQNVETFINMCANKN